MTTVLSTECYIYTCRFQERKIVTHSPGCHCVNVQDRWLNCFILRRVQQL